MILILIEVSIKFISVKNIELVSFISKQLLGVCSLWFLDWSKDKGYVNGTCKTNLSVSFT